MPFISVCQARSVTVLSAFMGFCCLSLWRSVCLSKYHSECRSLRPRRWLACISVSAPCSLPVLAGYICLSIFCLSVCLSVRLSVCAIDSLSVCLYVCRSFASRSFCPIAHRISVSLVQLSSYLSSCCLFVCLSIASSSHSSVFRSLCLSKSVWTCLSACLSVTLCVILRLHTLSFRNNCCFAFSISLEETLGTK